jgi:hypothetical protein
MSFTVGEGDSGWTLDVLCSDKNGPVELMAATDIRAWIGSISSVGLVCTAVDDYAFEGNPGTSGKKAIARYMGTSAETRFPGTHKGRIQASWGDGTVTSFPDTVDGYFDFIVTRR